MNKTRCQQANRIHFCSYRRQICGPKLTPVSPSKRTDGINLNQRIEYWGEGSCPLPPSPTSPHPSGYTTVWLCTQGCIPVWFPHPKVIHMGNCNSMCILSENTGFWRKIYEVWNKLDHNTLLFNLFPFCSSLLGCAGLAGSEELSEKWSSLVSHAQSHLVFIVC